MTDEPHQAPQQDPPQWTPDETQTQWVQAGQQPEGAREWAPSEPEAEEYPPQWAPWDESAEGAVWPASDPAAQTWQQPQQAPDVPLQWSPPSYGDQGQPGQDKQRGPSALAKAMSVGNLGALRLFAQVACVVLLLVGLTFDNGGTNGWGDYTAWALFAVVCAVLQLAPIVGKSLGLTDENSWFLAAVGTAGLALYWVIIVLPGASSNTGFAQTLAVGFAVIGLWLSPGRRE